MTARQSSTGWRIRTWTALCLCTASISSAVAAVTFDDLQGWWCAEPSFDGETARVCLHFVEQDSKPSVRISMLDIGGYDAPLGTVTITGDDVDLGAFTFSLRYDAQNKTLHGVLPEAAVPIYKIPVTFARVSTPDNPASRIPAVPSPKIRWMFETQSPIWAALAHDVRTGLIFVGDDAGTLHALDADGVERWTFATGKPIKARPALIDTALFVSSDAGFLYKLDARTGRELWRAQIDSGSPARIPASDEKSRWDRYGSSVISDATRVFVASRDKHLYALDRNTGKLIWKIAANDIMTATPARYRDMILFASYDGKVMAVDAHDGKARWTYDAKLPVAGDITVADGRAYVGSRTYELIALDAESGRESWKRYYWFSWIESPPVVFDGTVYTGSSDGVRVFAFDAATGARRWRTGVPGWSWSRPAVSEGLVVAGTVGLGRYPGPRVGSLVGIDRTSGAIRWMHLEPPDAQTQDKRIEWGFAAAPLIVGDVVYAADLRGRVYAFEL